MVRWLDVGGDDTLKTALLVEKRGDDEFYGAWTYDPGFVDRCLAHLDPAYVDASDGTRPQPHD